MKEQFIVVLKTALFSLLAYQASICIFTEIKLKAKSSEKNELYILMNRLNELEEFIDNNEKNYSSDLITKNNYISNIELYKKELSSVKADYKRFAKKHDI